MNVYTVHGKTHGIVKGLYPNYLFILGLFTQVFLDVDESISCDKYKLSLGNIVPKKNIGIFLRFTTLYSKEERAL